MEDSKRKFHYNFNYKRAGTEDIELLVKVRLEVLRAANHLSDDTQMAFVTKYMWHILFSMKKKLSAREELAFSE